MRMKALLKISFINRHIMLEYTDHDDLNIFYFTKVYYESYSSALLYTFSAESKAELGGSI